jgi:hypothetical protein
VSSLDEARTYLESRGLTREIMRAARLRSKDGRMWFPWPAPDGTEIYSTGRSLNGTEPRYLHTKGERPALYASPGAWQSSRVAVVEGHIDALVCAQAGTAAFALSGSSLSDAAVEILATKDEVLIVPDCDDVGARWCDAAIEALEGRVNCLVVTLPAGYKDLGDVAAAADDPGEAIAEVLDIAVPVEPGWHTTWGPDESESYDDPPALMARTDGENLLYAGKRHWFQGEPESAKTFGALVAVADALRAGELVVFVDFEDARTPLVAKLEVMGAPVERFVYVRPTEPLEGKAIADVERLMAMGPGLVVLDGVAEAMALQGLDPVRNMDTAVFVRDVLDRFHGATLVVIDHVARGDAGKGRYAYGSQHKLAAVDGAAYRFEVIQPFSREQGGASRIDVAKDRPGYVRSFALNKERAGVLRVVPTEDGISVTVEPPVVVSEEHDEGEISYTQRRVLDVLGDEHHALTYREIGDRLASDGRGKPLKRNTIRSALDALIAQGLADGSRTEGGSTSSFWRCS